MSANTFPTLLETFFTERLVQQKHVSAQWRFLKRIPLICIYIFSASRNLAGAFFASGYT